MADPQNEGETLRFIDASRAMTTKPQDKEVEGAMPAQTLCQAGKAEHYYASNSVPTSKLVNWVRICMTCGHIDGVDLDREIETHYRKKFVDELLEKMPNGPKQVDKTPKPVTERVEEPFGSGVPGISAHTIETGETYSEQDLENATFECAKPYLAEVKQLIKEIGDSDAISI